MNQHGPLLRGAAVTTDAVDLCLPVEHLEKLVDQTLAIGDFFAVWLIWGGEELQSVFRAASNCPLEEAQLKNRLLQEGTFTEPPPNGLTKLRTDREILSSQAAHSDNLQVFSQVIPVEQGETYGFLLALKQQEEVEQQPKTEALLEMVGQQIGHHFQCSSESIERKQMSEEMSRNLAMLEESIESNQIGLWELDIRTGQTVWSDLVYAIHEVSLDFDHNKNKGIEFYHPDYRGIISEALERCILYDERFDVSCLLITAKGNRRWVRATGRRLGDKILGSFQDISAFKENELKFKAILNSTFSFIGFLDKQGLLLEVNDTALQTAGLEPSDVIGKPFWEGYWWQISKQTQEELKQNFYRALQGEEVVYEVVVWIAHKQPITILFSLKPIKDEQGKVAYVVSEGRPIQEIVDARVRYKSVLEGTNVGTWEWNIQTGETVFNERWAEIIGYSLEELGPMSIDLWLRHAHPEDLKKSEERLEACFLGKAEFYEVEVRMRHKKGHWVWVLDRGKVFEWTEDGKPVKMYGTHQEITEKKAQELEVTYQRDLLNTLFEWSPFGIALNERQTGTYLDANAKLLESIGLEKEELLAMGPEQCFSKNYTKLWEQAEPSISKDRRFGPLTLRYFRKDGSTFPAIVRGVVVEDNNGQELVWSFVQDVSEVDEAKRKLQETYDRLQAVLRASTQVCVVATNKDGVIDLFNPGAENLLGYRAEELLGKHGPELLFDSRDIAQEEQALEAIGSPWKGFKALAFGALVGKPKVREWQLRHQSGASIPVLMSVAPIKEPSGEHGLLAVALDITELKKVETELKTMLEISQKQNERLNNFAHIVSHNLKSHSAGISGVLSFLEEELPYLKQNELYALISKAIKSMNQTVTDLGDVVKYNINNQPFSYIFVRGVVENNLESLAPLLLESNIALDLRLDSGLAVKAIPAYLDSVVFNLLSNAIKYASKDRNSHLYIYAHERNNNWVICFKDNGLGIDLEKHKEHLFGMYSTFHSHPEARGLGLFMVKSQMESMGGSIEVESWEGKGSIFKLVFPK